MTLLVDEMTNSHSQRVGPTGTVEFVTDVTRLRKFGPLVLGSLLIAANLWFGASVFEPVQRGSGPAEYILVSSSYQGLFADWAMAFALLTAASWRVVRRGDSPADALHARTFGWLIVPLLPLATLLAPDLGRWPAFMYVLFELRWCWLGLVLAVWLSEVHPGLAKQLIEGDGGRGRLLPIVTLVVVPVAVAIVSTPNLRFNGTLHGDEPKYLRYCENFYQGMGFDVGAKRPLTDAQTAVPHVLGNWHLFAHAIEEEAQVAAGDLRRLVGAPAPSRLVAGEPGTNMFFAGKHPGTLYQLHNPGLSFILFPSYYIDRRWTGNGVGYQEELPANMPALNGMLLALYAGYGLAVFGLLRALRHSRSAALSVALMITLALPVGAFAFQIYPEIVAGIAISLLLVRLANERAWGSVSDFAAGLLAGSLPWLHVRLGLVTVVTIIWRGADRRQPWRTRLSFAAGALVGLGALSLYTYRLTGSLIPLSTYGAEVPLSLSRVVHGLPGFAFDRTFGLLPHSPIYLLALPGFTHLWNRRRGLAVLVALVAMASAVPAAGHGYWAGGATPARYLVCAIPLAAVLIAETIARWRGHRVFLPAAAVLTFISIETAVRYDFSHQKEIGPLVTPGFAGWRPNQLFPALGDGWPISALDARLLAAWTVVAVLLVLLPVLLRNVGRKRPGALTAGPVPPLRDVFASLIGIAVLGTTVAAATGREVSREYAVTTHDALGLAFRKFAELPACALCYSSRVGGVEPTVALGNDPDFVQLLAEPKSPASGQRVRVRVRPRSTIGEFMVGDILLDFGDGTSAHAQRTFGDLEVVHTYAAVGTYHLHATFRSSEGRLATAELDLRVSAGG